MEALEAIAHFRQPPRLYRRGEVVGRASVVPAKPGIYGWYFDELPGDLAFRGEPLPGDFRLLYVGIAPGGPPRGATPPSTMRIRLRTHARGTADASTLRLTLGCLMSDRLQSPLTQTPSGRWRFENREAALNEWLEHHARVCWIERERPWEIEADVIRALDLPLNRAHNQLHPFYSTLGAIRAEQKRRAIDRMRKAGPVGPAPAND